MTTSKEDTEIDDWPNCTVPDCEYKSWRGGSSPMCYAHSHGRNPEMSFEEYMNTPVKESK
jgi:hypothetical protein